MTVSKITGILWESVWEAFSLAVVLLVLGSVAVGLVGGLGRQMMPSLPPGLASGTSPELPPPAAHPHGTRVRREGRLGLAFALLYPGIVWLHLARHSRHPARRAFADRMHAAYWRVATQWFAVLVANAFRAFVGAMVLGFLSQFSYTQWLLHLLLKWLHPVLQQVVGLFVDNRELDTVNGLIAWYGANQLKFTFWLLYSSAIADDLGLPNWKTLLGRLRARLLPGPPSPRTPPPPSGHSETQTSRIILYLILIRLVYTMSFIKSPGS
jgi:hypothetical protein